MQYRDKEHFLEELSKSLDSALENGNVNKSEILKTDKNGQWSLDKSDAHGRTKTTINNGDSPSTARSNTMTAEKLDAGASGARMDKNPGGNKDDLGSGDKHGWVKTTINRGCSPSSVRSDVNQTNTVSRV